MTTAANNQGSSYGGGWYGYVDKDLRTILGRPVAGRFKTHFCGNGDLATCRDSLYAALDQAAIELEDELGNPNPDDWRADAAAERIFFSPGFLGHHDALDEPAHVPAGDQLLGPPLGLAYESVRAAREPAPGPLRRAVKLVRP